MKLSPFDLPGSFYKGNLHCHSNKSDGALSPEQVCQNYLQAGYDFLCISDHFVGLYDYPLTDVKRLETETFKIIKGAELHSGPMENGEIWHILANGLPDDFAPSDSPDFFVQENQESGSTIAQRAADAGAFVTIAHPQWSGLTLNDAKSISAVHAIEVYNHTSHVYVERGNGDYMVDLLVGSGRHINLIATDDAHFFGDDAFGGWVMVKSEEFSETGIVTALKKGQFYASQGPSLKSISLDTDKVFIESSPVEKIIIVGQGSSAQSVEEADMVSAEFTFDDIYWNSDWFRAIIVDSAGKKAWSNPYFREA